MVTNRVEGMLLMAVVTITTCGALGWWTGSVIVCLGVCVVLLIVDVVITLKLVAEAAPFTQNVIHHCPSCKEKLGVSDGLAASREYEEHLLKTGSDGQF
jgi:hypothetical protein